MNRSLSSPNGSQQASLNPIPWTSTEPRLNQSESSGTQVQKHLAFPEYGRLGNQLFQYFGLLAACRPEETVHLVGFNSLTTGFVSLGSPSVRIHAARSRTFLRALRLVSASRFSIDLETRNRTSQPRSSRTPWVARRAYFQVPEVLELGAQSSVDFAAGTYTRAREVLSDLNISEDFSFVHVRTGDYVRWPSTAAPGLLPEAWILSSTNSLRKRSGNRPIIVLGNNYLDSRIMAEKLRAQHVHESEAVDMCIMSLAQSGVLSASTFSLWGANFARSRHGAPGPWFAPKYWGGIRLNRWFPEHLIVNWLTYLPVDEFLKAAPGA